ncbi:hypothetical protein AB7849_09465 [Rhodanobacter sp. 115]|uniref:hypothetical protein n=1 Tax=Rhodanobacter sp. FW021-MT20 TaxID=1162282 RepID=UPI0034E54B50
MTPQEIAAGWRATQDDTTRTSGVVLIWNDRVTDWKDCLCDPHQNVPGVQAVDPDGHVFVAEGGNDYDGAERWAPTTL